MLCRIVIILLMLMPEAMAGMDFTGMSGDKSMIVTIPEFNSQREAEKFAIRHLGVEQVRRKLRKQAIWYRDFAKLDDAPNAFQAKNSGFNHAQAELCQRAYDIMTEYKRTHPDVGASVYAESIPLDFKNKRCHLNTRPI